MPLPKNFKFSKNSAIQASIECRAVALFGPDWRTVCSPATDRFGEAAIAAGGRSMSYFFGGMWAFRGRSRHDLPDGSPSYIAFHAGGNVQAFSHFIKDHLQDPPDGSPAHIEYAPDGVIKCGRSSATGHLTAAQTAERIKAAQVRSVAALLAKANQSVMPSGRPLP